MVLLSIKATADIEAEITVVQPIPALRVVTDSPQIKLVAQPAAVSIIIRTDSPQFRLIADPPLSGSTLAIRTDSVKLLANATALKPVITGVQVRLVAQPAAVSIIIRTGPLDVSLTASGDGAAFLFNRDMVIAGDPAFAAGSITEALLLGVVLGPVPEFRSVANSGQLRLQNAGDVQFRQISNDTELSHNIISHNAVNGTIIFDLKLPLWNVQQDFPVRINYGSDTQFPPQNTTRPQITGTTVVGSVLQCSQGQWTGTEPITYSYQWLNEGVAISGATLFEYTTVPGDVGDTITCLVTASNAAGSPVPLITSNSIDVVDVTPPPPTDFYPVPPSSIENSYTGTTYYVGPNRNGISTDIDAPGGFQATIQGVNDGSKVIVKPGHYPGFEAHPKSGQTGRIKIKAQFPVFTDVDTSGPNGGMIGYNENGQHSTCGWIRLIGYQNVWVEGFRMGDADPSTSDTTTWPTEGWRFGGNGNVNSRSWYTKNYHKNALGRQLFIDGPQKHVVFKNYFLATYRGVSQHPPEIDWWSDYGIFGYENRLEETYISQNIFRGGHTQTVSFKRQAKNVHVLGNVFDQNYFYGPGSGSTGGTALAVGQEPDQFDANVEPNDRTCLFARVAFNHFRKTGNGLVVLFSSVVTGICEDNHFYNPGGSRPAAIAMDCYSPSDYGTQVGPRHPTSYLCRRNTFHNPSALGILIGRPYLRESLHRVLITFENNISTSDIVAGYHASGGFGGEGTGPDFQLNARFQIKLGTNHKVAPDSTLNFNQDIKVGNVTLWPN